MIKHKKPVYNIICPNDGYPYSYIKNRKIGLRLLRTLDNGVDDTPPDIVIALTEKLNDKTPSINKARNK